MRRPVLLLIALATAGACSSSDGKKDAPAVSTSSTPTTHMMTFEECQKSGEYPGGRYAVEYDNGVCKVQKPTATTATPETTATTAAVSYANCDAVRAAGKAPLHKGDPGYSTKLDRDGDGIACDT
jgi:hypothetical protein